MKYNLLALAGLLTLTAIAAPEQATTQQKPAPAEPLQNDVRPPSGRINPNRPFQIRVVSRTKDPVIATLLPAAGDRPLAPGKSVTFGQLHTKYLQLPVDLQVSLVDVPDPNNPVSVFLDLNVSGNQVNVFVRTAASGSGNASQSIDINEKGLIYVY